MSIKAGYATPLFHVREIAQSIRFYELLGFETIDTDRSEPLGWARLHCDGGAIMFVKAEEGHQNDRSTQRVILYMYSPDLAGLREQLIAGGIQVPAILYPGYMPSGEMHLSDPDGYGVQIGHWGKAEQEAWEKRIGR